MDAIGELFGEEVLNIGDQDGSGVWSPEQVREFNLPTAPPKPTDRRAFRGETCQAEALAPDVLAGILRDALEARIDRRVLDRVLRHERQVRRELMTRLSR